MNVGAPARPSKWLASLTMPFPAGRAAAGLTRPSFLGVVRQACRPARSWRTAHMDHDDHQRDHRHHEDAEDHEEGELLPARRQRGRQGGRVDHVHLRVPTLSHPVDTLQQWASSLPSPPDRRTGRFRAIAVPGRSGGTGSPRVRRLSARRRRRLAPASIPAWPAGCGPGWRTPPTTSLPGAGPARSAPLFPRACAKSLGLARRAARDHGRYHRGAVGPWACPTEGLALTRPGRTPSCSGHSCHTGRDPGTVGRRGRCIALRTGQRGTRAREIESLPAAARDRPRKTLAIPRPQTCSGATPPFAPGWLPRTNDRVAIPLAGGTGRPERGVFDLLVGAPHSTANRATLCAVGLRPADMGRGAARAAFPWPCSKRSAAATPPFRLAVLQSASGRYGVEDVLEEHLRTLASHMLAPCRHTSRP